MNAISDLMRAANNSLVYVNFSTLYNMIELLNILLGICAFLVTLKLIKLLRFHPKIYYLSATLRSSKFDLASFGVIFLVMWLAFVQLMHLFYHESSLGFSSIIRSMLTCFKIILGKFELDELLRVNLNRK